MVSWAPSRTAPWPAGHPAKQLDGQLVTEPNSSMASCSPSQTAPWPAGGHLVTELNRSMARRWPAGHPAGQLHVNLVASWWPRSTGHPTRRLNRSVRPVFRSNVPVRPVSTGQTRWFDPGGRLFDQYSPVEQACLTGTLVEQACLTGTLVEQAGSAGDPGDRSSGATCSTSRYRSTRVSQAPAARTALSERLMLAVRAGSSMASWSPS
ncbi:hypothetical protein PCANC_19755 [Puccinia coronata f. sp. avenae]|uniref:Uncharacterized protein n=1 Tax=Puccinia coronata f. sp. avenae TaxID=200324 RepID=A0A2N5SM28_9BASI|nr:hypothetical protein PCANC_19755 [Puccinia coronata f. sp. avenae]